MIDSHLLALFIPTFFLVSLTPGMCMTLAMTLGMSIGVRNTFWMMWGELLGVALVAIAAVVGVSTVMLKYPQLFNGLKVIGGLYLFYVAISMWRSKGKLAVNNSVKAVIVNKKQLFNQGFITAIANPKGWAFMVSLLPPFINPQIELTFQLSVLIAVILVSEFSCMLLYATGGKNLGKILTRNNNVKRLNQISGTLMMLVALWLVSS